MSALDDDENDATRHPLNSWSRCRPPAAGSGEPLAGSFRFFVTALCCSPFNAAPSGAPIVPKWFR